MAKRKITVEQVKADDRYLGEFLEENQGLILHVIKNRFSNLYGACLDKDDLIQYGNVALAKAVKAYDKDRVGKAAFASLAIRIILNEILQAIRAHQKNFKYNIQVYSFDDTCVVGKHKNKELTYLEMLEDTSEGGDLFDLMDTKYTYRLFLDSLTEQQRKIIQLNMNDVLQINMSKILDLSQSYISRLIIKIQEQFNLLKNEGDEIEKSIDEIIDFLVCNPGEFIEAKELKYRKVVNKNVILYTARIFCRIAYKRLERCGYVLEYRSEDVARIISCPKVYRPIR